MIMFKFSMILKFSLALPLIAHPHVSRSIARTLVRLLLVAPLAVLLARSPRSLSRRLFPQLPPARRIAPPPLALPPARRVAPPPLAVTCLLPRSPRRAAPPLLAASSHASLARRAVPPPSPRRASPACRAALRLPPLAAPPPPLAAPRRSSSPRSSCRASSRRSPDLLIHARPHLRGASQHAPSSLRSARPFPLTRFSALVLYRPLATPSTWLGVRADLRWRIYGGLRFVRPSFLVGAPEKGIHRDGVSIQSRLLLSNRSRQAVWQHHRWLGATSVSTTAVAWSHERKGGWERTASLLLAGTGWCVCHSKADPTEPCKHPSCFLQSSPLHCYILVSLSYQYSADCFLYSTDLVVYVLPELQGNQLTWCNGWRSVDVFVQSAEICF
ncbi:vegetative cell wall protein gp1-like [Hordeum vulgare subsp. vulgare]|uniref:vegetative cell wall protein gp1-like n=1 Tax=Hordeum vulgare subsp. vulgare TaxID=112509 RepID=UPI001D1A4E3F|nr:vegetative cell wall protein gp1-like [Hordeum vulgare subsp. vulgare]